MRAMASKLTTDNYYRFGLLAAGGVVLYVVYPFLKSVFGLLTDTVNVVAKAPVVVAKLPDIPSDLSNQGAGPGNPAGYATGFADWIFSL